MLNNFRTLQSLLFSHGARWLLFRIGYALRKHTGWIRRRMPSYSWNERPLNSWLKSHIPSNPEEYAQWRSQKSPKFFRAEPFGFAQDKLRGSLVEAQLPSEISWNRQTAVDEAERILNGELKYFAHKFVKTGFPPNWHQDPVSGKKLDASKHWSELSDDVGVDIKFIWEASRFSMVYTLVRAYVSTRDEKYAEAFWTLLESWTESNPPNLGPNWMDGQEAALRLMAWMFGYYQFSDSPLTTPERIVKFTVLVAAHAERIYKNIGYAISTHSNHTISEAFGLWLVGHLFPELKDAEEYQEFGRKLLEQEVLKQIYLDGTYSMYSLNYHRFILHIYIYAIRLAEIHQTPFSKLIYERISTSIDFLSQLIDPKTGEMPVYGSNDGALVLPLNDCDFNDYRPLLQLGSYLTKKELLFEPGPWDEDIFWLFGKQALIRAPARTLGLRERTGSEVEPQRNNSSRLNSAFPQGGIYILRDTNSKIVVRCTDFHSRPSHADQLNVDVWWRGKNIACDAGTYLYSGEGIWRNGLAHSSVHNTVTVDYQDQMKMLTRFTWTDWAKGTVVRQEGNAWQGEHDGYKRLADPVNHKRTVISLGEDRWLVADLLDGTQPHHYALHWLLADFPFEQQEHSILLFLDSSKPRVQVGIVEGKSTFSVVRTDPNSTRGWRSKYYADKESAISIMLETDQPHARFWTFFGSEYDEVELTGNELKIRFDGQESLINISSL